MIRNVVRITAALALAACHPTPACPPNQTECGATCFDLQSTASNCGACSIACVTDQVCVGGACVYDTCSTPDLYVACWMGGGFTGMCSASGEQLPTATLSAPAPDAGVVSTGTVVVPELQSVIFTGPTTLWGLDVENAQIDVFDTSSWPPTVVTSLAAGVYGYDPTAMIACNGQVLLLRSSTPLLEVFDGTTGAFVNEVSLALDGGYPYPNSVACSGTTAYVADDSDDVVFSVDLGTYTVTNIIGLPIGDEVPPASADGGTFYPSLGEVGVVAPAGGSAKIFMATQPYTVFDLSDGGMLTQVVSDSLAFETSPAFSSLSAPVDVGCLDALALVPSPDQSTLYAACGGPFHIFGTPNLSGQIGVISVSGLAAQTPITVPLSNPGSMAFLKNGLLAIADTGQEKVAFYNPADGGVTSALVACPPLPDGGVNPLQFISAVVPAP